jgi:hypothetical protein
MTMTYALLSACIPNRWASLSHPCPLQEDGIRAAKGKKSKSGGGGFQTMGVCKPLRLRVSPRWAGCITLMLMGHCTAGLSANVLKGVLRKGYKVPTPIQRKTIPLALEVRATCFAVADRPACALFSACDQPPTCGVGDDVIICLCRGGMWWPWRGRGRARLRRF